MRILVAYDASPGADEALSDLVRAGFPEDADVRVFSVCPECGPRPGAASSAASFGLRPRGDRADFALEHARSVAARGAERLQGARPGWRLSHGAARGDACAAIVAEAHDWHADVVAVGSHAAAKHAVPLGSVARCVVDEAPCSVRVGRSRSESIAARPPRVLVGYDATDGAAAAVAAVAARTWPAGTEARVLVAVDPLDAHADPRREPPLPWSELRTRVARWADELRARGLDATSDLVTGDARRVLADEAARWGADVLFVGAHGTRAPSRPLAGSVASATVAAAPCSVEVVRPAAVAAAV